MIDVIKATIKIGNNKSVSGILESRNDNYIFNSWSNEDYNVVPRANLYGKTHDNNHISLLDCIGSKYTYSRNDEKTYGSEIHPDIIITGCDYIHPESDKFQSITMSVGNPEKLIILLSSFGYTVAPSKKLIEALNEMQTTPKFEEGYHPVIAYYNGKNDIIRQETSLGLINIKNCISHDLDGKPSGIEIRNNLSIKIHFSTAVDIYEALSRACKASLFFRFIGGEGLFFNKISITKNNCEHPYSEYVIYDNNDCWGREVTTSKNKFPLINIDSSQFLPILKSWFDKEDREEVRYRFYDTYFKVNYSSERLISAANMFECFPKLISGKQSLRDRVNERLDIVNTQLSNRELSRDNLDFIVDAAIKARNYFVHGTKYKKLSVEQLYDFLPLFVDTFEYIYAISELIEAGLDINVIREKSNWHRIEECELVINSQYEKLKAAILQ